MLEYKAERAGTRVFRVNPRGTSEGLSFEDPFRDYISANRIKMRGRESPDPPAAQPHWNRYVHSPVDEVGDRTAKVPGLQEANGLGSPHLLTVRLS
jgi:hypothetical protein